MVHRIAPVKISPNKVISLIGAVGLVVGFWVGGRVVSPVPNPVPVARLSVA